MSTAAELIAQADALLESVDPAAVDADLASLLASYRSVQGSPAAWITARAVVRCADRLGVVPDAGAGAKALDAMTAAELKDELERRNEGRDEDARIVPESTKKADLLAALAADDNA